MITNCKDVDVVVVCFAGARLYRLGKLTKKKPRRLSVIKASWLIIFRKVAMYYENEKNI
jgi:hypothetical protein